MNPIRKPRRGQRLKMEEMNNQNTDSHPQKKKIYEELKENGFLDEMRVTVLLKNGMRGSYPQSKLAELEKKGLLAPGTIRHL